MPEVQKVVLPPPTHGTSIVKAEPMLSGCLVLRAYPLLLGHQERSLSIWTGPVLNIESCASGPSSEFGPRPPLYALDTSGTGVQMLQHFEHHTFRAGRPHANGCGDLLSGHCTLGRPGAGETFRAHSPRKKSNGPPGAEVDVVHFPGSGVGVPAVAGGGGAVPLSQDRSSELPGSPCRDSILQTLKCW